MQQTWVQFLNWEDPLEMEMATYFNILAWEIPWTEEIGGLQTMRSQRIGHDLATEHTCSENKRSTLLANVKYTMLYY